MMRPKESRDYQAWTACAPSGPLQTTVKQPPSALRLTHRADEDVRAAAGTSLTLALLLLVRLAASCIAMRKESLLTSFTLK